MFLLASVSCWLRCDADRSRGSASLVRGCSNVVLAGLVALRASPLARRRILQRAGGVLTTLPSGNMDGHPPRSLSGRMGGALTTLPSRRVGWTPAEGGVFAYTFGGVIPQLFGGASAPTWAACSLQRPQPGGLSHSPRKPVPTLATGAADFLARAEQEAPQVRKWQRGGNTRPSNNRKTSGARDPLNPLDRRHRAQQTRAIASPAACS